ncbi:Fructokinase [hydrothermal vent metagenome]|uniref:Fructokinase n=1 Tax=hydrothermal vent metagenome TaxID=652676 RepID=A0A3B0RSP5_9ZZZZ
MTKSAKFDVCGIGNAIVDVIATVPESFLFEQDITKGAMTLIDQDRATALYQRLPDAKQTSGGSAANTIAGIASYGGTAAYLGKVGEDALGAIFADDLREIGVQYAVAPLQNGPQTARCLIAVTPDAQRSMSTFLGASAEFGSQDLDAQTIQDAAITYMEGYLFDREPAKQAFVEAAEIARAAGRKTAITLSDLFCVDRHRAAFLHLIRGHMDIVFANETELLSLYQTTSMETAVAQVRKDSNFAVVTLGEKGSLIMDKDQVVEIAAEKVTTVVDTTGAGDLYAAGVLYGLASGLSLSRCGELGSKAAAEIISHYGARPAISLASLL